MSGYHIAVGLVMLSGVVVIAVAAYSDARQPLAGNSKRLETPKKVVAAVTIKK